MTTPPRTPLDVDRSKACPLDVERLAAGLHRYFEACDGGCPHDEGYGDTEGKCKDAAVFLAAIEGSTE